MSLIETVPARLGEIRAASTAGGGTALSTTAVFIQLPIGTQHVFLTARNFTTAVVAKVALNPYVIVMKTADSGATWTDYSENAQDGNAGTDVTLSSLDTLANGDSLWVGSHIPFRGLAVDVDAANGTASVMTGTYWNGTALSNITLTDGTINTGAALGQDGNITWTVPTDWVPAKLTALIAGSGAAPQSAAPAMFWVRLVFSAALDSSTTLNSIVAMNRSTAYAELVTGQTLEVPALWGPGGVGCVEALTDAGTANLIVNAATRGGKFRS